MHARYLIVNADDFGRSEGINRGIIEAHERGIVTSTSLMVRYPAAAEAAAYAKQRRQLTVGLHFDLSEWAYAAGQWRMLYENADSKSADAIRIEFLRQLAVFEELVGEPPTHLDSHQHVHRSEPALGVLQEECRRLQIPLRHFTPRLSYCGDFYGQSNRGEPFAEGISVSQLCRAISTLPAGWTELACHPGYVDGLDSSYRAEREQELRALCSAEVRQAIEKNEVQLRSFRDFSGA